MPVYRGSDGKIIEEKINKREEEDQSIDGTQRSLPPAPSGGDRAVGGHRRQEDQQRLQERDEKSDSMDDPVVGWLVIVEGPGKGRAVKLGRGSNSIGRGETDRVNLTFGDDQISSDGHAIVTYDPRSRKFYVQHGGGISLTYLNDEPVLIPIELPAYSHIVIGNTVLRFVPLCGDAFDWEDVDEADRSQRIATRGTVPADDSVEAQERGETVNEIDMPAKAPERETVDETVVRQHDAQPLERNKKTKGKRLAAVICVVALIVAGVAGSFAIDEILHWAVWNNARKTAEVLFQIGADANAKNKYGETPLHKAAQYNAYEMVEVLLNQEADVEAKNDDGETPLHKAAQYNAYEMVEVLLNQGADVEAKNNNGETPLHKAARHNAYEMVEVLLNQGADAEAKADDGMTPLHWAALNNTPETAELLLSKGADAEAKDKYGNTPLRLAERSNHEETVAVLRRYGVKK